MSSREFVYEKFSAFYNKPSTNIPPPTLFAQREFAFLLFKERVMLRHKGFANPKTLAAFMRERIPSDVYHSCAYYENPEAEMEKKGWQGADLVFDIDADHIPTSCNKIHDEWTCSNVACGFSGKGITPENCPVCGGVKFETKTWPCDQCLASAKEETVKLVDMLESDFGFSKDEIHVFFSGHRGYHIHVENKAVQSLDAMARKEIVDYVSGIGLAMFEKDESKRKRSSEVFSLSNFGWNRRLKDGIRKLLLKASKEDLKNIGITKPDLILKNKEAILKKCLEDNRWDSVRGIGIETWKRLAEHARDSESAKIDTVVTTDIHRLIRANGTLHGKTGLLKIEFPTSRLDSFDPFNEAVAFKEGTAQIIVSNAPEFRLRGETLGPYKNQKVELPMAAAVLLICKNRAEVVT
ncbi:MAG: DNA primase small subunit domain-containing protein [Candidatus Bathyarchaeia archaeon]